MTFLSILWENFGKMVSLDENPNLVIYFAISINIKLKFHSRISTLLHICLL